MAFALPWLMAHADPAEQAAMRAEAPLPLKLLWYASRGRYARLAGRALGEYVDSPYERGVAVQTM